MNNKTKKIDTSVNVKLERYECEIVMKILSRYLYFLKDSPDFLSLTPKISHTLYIIKKFQDAYNKEDKQMILQYEFSIKYQGKNERLDEEYYDTEIYDFDHDITEQDIIAFLTEVLKLTSHVIHSIYDYLDIDTITDNSIFYEFMLERYESQARAEFYKGDK